MAAKADGVIKQGQTKSRNVKATSHFVYYYHKNKFEFKTSRHTGWETLHRQTSQQAVTGAAFTWYNSSDLIHEIQ
jgi:hypothetical protein